MLTRSTSSHLFTLSIACLVLSFFANAQKGTAPSGYYPAGYSGDIFSGELVPSDDAKAVKLLYKNSSKTESFEGMIETACQAPTKADPHTNKELHLSAIPAGTILTVYYTPTSAKVDGKKVHMNLIWGMRFDVVNGQRLTDPERPIISCSHQRSAPFRAF